MLISLTMHLTVSARSVLIEQNHLTKKLTECNNVILQDTTCTLCLMSSRLWHWVALELQWWSDSTSIATLLPKAIQDLIVTHGSTAKPVLLRGLNSRKTAKKEIPCILYLLNVCVHMNICKIIRSFSDIRQLITVRHLYIISVGFLGVYSQPSSWMCV